MRFQSIAAASALVLCAAAWGVASIPGEAVAEGCRDACKRQRAEDGLICRKISPENQERCQRNANEREAACYQGCTPNDLDACKRGCDRKARAGHKKCEGLPVGSPERAKCRQAVEDQRGSCYRECERKWR